MTNRELRLAIEAFGDGLALPLHERHGLRFFMQCNANDYQHQTVAALIQCMPGRSGHKIHPTPNRDPRLVFNPGANQWEPETAQNEVDKQYIENRLSMCRHIARKLAQLEDWK